ncbi:MAG TPA: SpoIID/LytB domain-containing protein [Solirubrobacteraceae bacterium]|jgi:stage II sporulation protein D|nr:SpoIID/LytB domain-containing protein [Solirubrobacteraceae bacterium]
MLAINSTYHRIAVRPARALAALASALICACAATAGAARAANLVISGGGYGHGVGMSQEGALGYAERGYSYRQILAHYYVGTSIATAPANTTVRVLIGGKVQPIALETYVRGVVSAEVSPSWPLAALEAQAVASRTYALTAHAGGAKFDVYADTRSQVYRGVAAQTPQTDAAVAATAGQIVTYAGKPAITYFFASSGGRTENVEDSFIGSQPQPWLRGVVDQYEPSGDNHAWKLSLSFAAAAADLHGLVRGGFEGIEVLKRGFSPRIVSAYVLGSGGRTAVSGPTLAERLGMFSAWAYFSTSEGQTIKPEPDRSGWTPLTSPAPAAAPAPAPSAQEGGGVAAGAAPEATAGSASASATSAQSSSAGGAAAPLE